VTRAPLYLDALLDGIVSGRIAAPPGKVMVIDVQHSSWCRKPQGKTCTCRPEFKVREARRGK
jgi:hypothetical protein